MTAYHPTPPSVNHGLGATESVGRKNIDRMLKLSSMEQVTHYGLNGRTTSIFPTSSKTLSHEDGLLGEGIPGHKSKPDTLVKPNETMKMSVDKRYIPEMVWRHRFSTAEIWKCPRISVGSARVLLFRTLFPITKLVGDEFLHTWWVIVKCHLTLWKSGIHHQDINPSNLMYYLDAEGKIMGVLNDFDLALLEDVPTGTERTGMAPFMPVATRLLRLEAVPDEVIHWYKHNVESFIWVLTWASLRYDDGKLKKDPPLEEWLECDAIGCRMEKHDFLCMSNRRNMPAGVGHEKNFQLANNCLYMLTRLLVERKNQNTDVDEVFRTLLSNQVKPYLESSM